MSSEPSLYLESESLAKLIWVSGRASDLVMASNGEVGGKLERLQYHLEGFIENLRTVGVIAGDFQQNGQNNFNEKL